MRFTAGSQRLNKLTSHWGRNAIKAVSARFDKETNRTLARTTTATHEFHAADTEILATLLLWNLKFGISPSSLLVFLSEKDYLLL